MTRIGLRATVLTLGLALVGGSATVWAGPSAPPGGDFQKVSALVALPDFIPGMGTLYVDPKTLPAGPFLAYDRDGKLVSSIYMIPMKDLDAKKAFTDLGAARANVDHVDLYYNAGHPGVAEPHYHIVVWYVSPQQAASLK
jgi:ABC-type glycerol-3-phosphate transport system substrate-binding protein